MLTVNSNREFFTRLNHLQTRLRELDPLLNWSNYVSPSGFATYATQIAPNSSDLFTPEQRTQLLSIINEMHELTNDAIALLDYTSRPQSM